ncbi:hypothetical protein PTT_13124 [Pyrenophora teres f. teres 0-1]|uniref:Uncharacterized protein n=1 Tax=Pyrenophora teres f. teres (strain 0-1) TaxID=861557 RepID=E3RVD3_PYRTT|nr:hypothetical protein PTT_13124 [Pyrenophora teres f. teres 0-1]KAE8844425.1 hypothetical protein PTNB85_02690 [Pyrenophora teres f. teres]
MYSNWQCLYKYYIPQPVRRPLKKTSQTHPQSVEGVRLDLVFVTTKEHDKGEEQKIAVIEFKRRGLINPEQFKDAILTGDPSQQEINKKLAKAGTKTLLKENAEVFCKQTSAYAYMSACKHVALSNWDHLVLFEFASLNSKGKDDYSAGDTANISWVYENSSVLEEHSMHRQLYMKLGEVKVGTIRKALLGWLVQAFEDSLKIQEKD